MTPIPFFAPPDPPPRDFEEAFRRGFERQTVRDWPGAIFWYQQALAFRPGSAETYNNLGALLLETGRREAARGCFETALSLRPRYLRPHLGLATLFQADNLYEQAAVHFRQALAIDPDIANARFNLGLMAQFTGDHDEAARELRTAAAALTDNPNAFSQYLLCLNYHPDLSGEALLAEHRRFGERYPLPTPTRRGNLPDPERRLRVGYLGVDFRRHLGASFLAPALERADRENFELFAYSALPPHGEDGWTARFRLMVDHWARVDQMDDAALDARIRADAIDVLVDVAGHSGLNRLAALAGKPAPVVVTWLGYPNTTGLPAVDVRLVDGVTDPEGVADAHASERLVRLPAPFICFAPPADAPAPTPPPMIRNGYVTFGSLNTLTKHTPAVFDLWARTLAAVPGARLVLKDRSFVHASARERLAAPFAAHGVAADRLTLLGWTPAPDDHLARYGDIDICLDPFPYNGTITTCDALWMGAPVLTLPGSRHAARVGASLMTSVGLADWVATDPADFIARAVAFAGDPARLAALRAGMRERLTASPLCDAAGFARKLERVYRDLWREWCASAEAAPSPSPRSPC